VALRPVASADSMPRRAAPAPAGPRLRRVGPFSAGSTGSGFVVSASGHLITNRHVVRGCAAVRVRPEGGVPRAATVVALDPDDDLALLKTDTTFASVAAFRGGMDPRAGEDVVAVGYPLNGLLADQPHVTIGSISALAGLYNDLHELTISTPVQPGNSGGPLLDAHGTVVGVVVTKLNARAVAEETGDLPQNVNFAIKGAIAREFLASQGVVPVTGIASESRSALSNADVGDVGRRVTVLVECVK
jgi:S1-C subfamily serine protease